MNKQTKKASVSNSLSLDESLLNFDEMKFAYIESTQTDTNTDTTKIDVEIDQKSNDNYKKEGYLELANAWISAFNKTTGKDELGVSAFESFVTSREFSRGMEIANIMHGKRLEEFAERLTVEFGFDNSLATESIIYFMSDPIVSNIFQIDCSKTTPTVAAEDIKNQILETNSAEELNYLKEQYYIQENSFIPVQENESQPQEEKPIEKPNEQEQKDTNPFDSRIPTIKIKDFSPKKMYDMYGNIDFDGENLIVIGPDGEETIEENPDEKLVKVATMNRIWKTTLLNFYLDPTDEEIAEVNATMFSGENAIILDRISKSLIKDELTSVDAILKNLATVENIENKRMFMFKAFDLLSNLSQFGNMELDFNGVLKNRKEYIDSLIGQATPTKETELEK